MARSVAVAAAMLVLAAAPFAAAVKPCGEWVLYKQCGEKWSDHKLGESGSTTICQAGCAMSSVAMALATDLERVDGEHTTPGTLNKWLVKHGGYVDSDELVWNAVAPLGRLHMNYFGTGLSAQQLREATHRCEPVVANVRGGSHWVLVVGYDDSDKDTFLVNDPGFPDTKYSYSGMSHWVRYTNHSSEAPDWAVQPGAASLARAARYTPAATGMDLVSTLEQVGRADAGEKGVDVSQPTSKSDLKCMKEKHGVSIVCARCYTEDGEVDGAAVDTLKAAQELGMQVHAYHFPCQNQDAKAQVDASIKHLRSHGVNFTTFWLDIENSDWGSDHARNIKFIKDLGEAARAHGADVGIYTSTWSWNPITGDTHDLSSKYRLWWPNYSTPPKKDFGNFEAFGGWKRPYLKQYQGNANLCGASVDVSWRPAGAAAAAPTRFEVAPAAPAAPAVSVETCGFMKALVDRTFHSHHDTWLCIAHYESSYEPHARNPSGATGLFQVMPMHCGSPGCPPRGSNCVRDLEDPEKNARCASTVYKEQGFGAWTTYPRCVRGGGPCQ